MKRAALMCLLVACGTPVRSSETCLPPPIMDYRYVCQFIVEANETLMRGLGGVDEKSGVRDYSFLVVNQAGFAWAQCQLLLRANQRILEDKCDAGKGVIHFRVGVAEPVG